VLIARFTTGEGAAFGVVEGDDGEARTIRRMEGQCNRRQWCAGVVERQLRKRERRARLEEQRDGEVHFGTFLTAQGRPVRGHERELIGDQRIPDNRFAVLELLGVVHEHQIAHHRPRRRGNVQRGAEYLIALRRAVVDGHFDVVLAR